MKKMIIAATVLSALFVANVQAADSMSKDHMAKDSMSKDHMAKDSMSKDHMAKKLHV
ncbi:pentapeptide MXKDX repeat protein [Klebsiella pneumoniae]|uniref:Pentapeptide MXKDX repeat protein n=1 Tax=Klebsiella pneumoniae TaxID=573 RepID=A0A377X9Q3_KLEPN|nr:pentapeptide MXKDX repeat protein [Klebsiella pneumoniae]